MPYASGRALSQLGSNLSGIGTLLYGMQQDREAKAERQAQIDRENQRYDTTLRMTPGVSEIRSVDGSGDTRSATLEAPDLPSRSGTPVPDDRAGLPGYTPRLANQSSGSVPPTAERQQVSQIRLPGIASVLQAPAGHTRLTDELSYNPNWEIDRQRAEEERELKQIEEAFMGLGYSETKARPLALVAVRGVDPTYRPITREEQLADNEATLKLEDEYEAIGDRRRASLERETWKQTTGTNVGGNGSGSGSGSNEGDMTLNQWLDYVQRTYVRSEERVDPETGEMTSVTIPLLTPQQEVDHARILARGGKPALTPARQPGASVQPTSAPAPTPRTRSEPSGSRGGRSAPAPAQPAQPAQPQQVSLNPAAVDTMLAELADVEDTEEAAAILSAGGFSQEEIAEFRRRRSAFSARSGPSGSRGSMPAPPRPAPPPPSADSPFLTTPQVAGQDTSRSGTPPLLRGPSRQPVLFRPSSPFPQRSR